jgi:hypothetical protein
MNGNQSGGPNTFQVILYDPNFYPTGTGDGEFMFQYLTWNDNQEAWTDFPYCTVGYKDHTSSMGNTLKNYNVLNPTMHAISAGTAILFTTTVNGVLTPAVLSVDLDGLTVPVPQGESVDAEFEIANTGQVTLVYSLGLTFNTRDEGGPDAYGYRWKDSDEDDGPTYGWVSNAGHTPVTFVHNDSTAGWFDTGFDFYLYGERQDRFRISPNGFLSFSSHSGAWSNQGLPSDIAPRNSVFVWWDDLRPLDNTAGYCTWYTNNVDSLVVSWTAVPHYNPGANGGPFTFQAILRSNGEITLQVPVHGQRPQRRPRACRATPATRAWACSTTSVLDTALRRRASPRRMGRAGPQTGVSGHGRQQRERAHHLQQHRRVRDAGLGDYSATLHISSQRPQRPRERAAGDVRRRRRPWATPCCP